MKTGMVHIDRDEALRYLGYRGQNIDAATDELLDSVIEEVTHECRPGSTYRIFTVEMPEGGGVFLCESSLLLPGNDIRRHLQTADLCAVMAVTLGRGIDEKIRHYSSVQPSRALIMDACATAAVEYACDRLEDEIRALADKKKLYLTARYSPGYGDLPLGLQPDIIRILDAHRRIGLAATESFLLTPQKSVTALAGFRREAPAAGERNCKGCSMYGSCPYRREGKYCER